jgi:hypothetical protein
VDGRARQRPIEGNEKAQTLARSRRRTRVPCGVSIRGFELAWYLEEKLLYRIERAVRALGIRRLPLTPYTIVEQSNSMMHGLSYLTYSYTYNDNRRKSEHSSVHGRTNPKP